MVLTHGTQTLYIVDYLCIIPALGEIISDCLKNSPQRKYVKRKLK